MKTVEENNRSKAYIKNLGIYSKISQMKIFRENSTLIIRERILIPLEDRIKVLQNYMAVWVTSADGRKLVKPILKKKSVIIDRNLTIDIGENEYDNCIDIADIKVCKQIPTIFHAPGKYDCISKAVFMGLRGKHKDRCCIRHSNHYRIGYLLLHEEMSHLVLTESNDISIHILYDP